VYTINKRRAADLIRPKPEMGAQLTADVKALTSISILPGGAAPALTVSSEDPSLRLYDRSPLL